ncbi:MAG: radical SAM protein [Candidatus Woesearchaeota archaeon]|nr:radical SAM protein [Candidatus Woesearchaeota archaeon]
MKQKNEMKVVLCSVPIRTDRHEIGSDEPEIPKIAIVSLINWMKKEGYSGDFFDIDILLPPEEEIFNYFKDKQPDVVGLSAVVSTSYHQVKDISKIIRKAYPSAAIVIGGNMAVSANLLLRKTEIDFCILGDGEITFVELLDYIREHGKEKDFEKLIKIKGLAYINKDDELEFTGYGTPIPDKENNFPDYSILKKGLLSKPYLIKNYFTPAKNSPMWFSNDPRAFEKDRKPNTAMVWVGKGCVARCTFCQRFSAGYHLFDLTKLEKHIIELKNKYDVGFIMIAGENFGLPREFAYQVSKILKKQDILWASGAARCTNFRPEDYEFFKAHGCAGIKFGVESGSQKMLSIMEKRFTVEQIYDALRLTIKYGLESPMAFCMGMPGETDKTIMETGKFVGKVFRLQGIAPNSLACFYALPFPGSVLYEYGQLRGVIGTSIDEEEDYLKYVSNRSTTKDNYINLTGMSNRKAIFWNYLVWYEATREYYTNKEIENITDKSKQSINFEGNNSNQKNKKSSVKELFQQLFRDNSLKQLLIKILAKPATGLNGFLCRSRFAAKIPRPILYPIMRNLLYTEYLIQTLFMYAKKIVTKDEWLELHFKFKRKKCKYKIMSSESLRKINKRLRERLPEPKTLTENNQILLYRGR